MTATYVDEYRAGIAKATARCAFDRPHLAHNHGDTTWCPGVEPVRRRPTTVTVKIAPDHPAVQSYVEKTLGDARDEIVAHLTERIAHHEAIAAEFGPNSPASCCDEDDPSFVEYDPAVHAAAVACAEELRAVRRTIAGDDRVVGRAEKSQAFFGG